VKGKTMAKIVRRPVGPDTVPASQLRDGQFALDREGNVVVKVCGQSFTPVHDTHALIMRVDTGIGSYDSSARFTPLYDADVTFVVGSDGAAE
jgi:hypothetical protein